MRSFDATVARRSSKGLRTIRAPHKQEEAFTQTCTRIPNWGLQLSNKQELLCWAHNMCWWLRESRLSNGRLRGASSIYSAKGLLNWNPDCFHTTCQWTRGQLVSFTSFQLLKSRECCSLTKMTLFISTRLINPEHFFSNFEQFYENLHGTGNLSLFFLLLIYHIRHIAKARQAKIIYQDINEWIV